MKLFLRATMLGLAIGGIVPASPAQESKAQPLKPNQLELLLTTSAATSFPTKHWSPWRLAGHCL